MQDTSDFLRKLQDLSGLATSSCLVTLDVNSLYTNIPHREGILACREALSLRELLYPPTEGLCDLIYIILTKNNFTFNGVHYLQIQGRAMGTHMAPSYANIFMDNWKENFYKYTPCVLWSGGDISTISLQSGHTVNLNYTPSLTTSTPFIQQLNSPVSGLPLVWYFLIQGSILKMVIFFTDLYCKPPDTHLQWKSCHPKHDKTSIPYDSAVSDSDFGNRAHELKNHLLKRGYKDHLVKPAIQLAASKPRVNCLKTKKKL